MGGREGVEAASFPLAHHFPLATSGQLPCFTCFKWALLISQFLTLALADLFGASGLSHTVWFALGSYLKSGELSLLCHASRVFQSKFIIF